MSVFDRMTYYEKWFVVGLIAGIVAGLTATAFYTLLHLTETLFIEKLVGMSYPRVTHKG